MEHKLLVNSKGINFNGNKEEHYVTFIVDEGFYEIMETGMELPVDIEEDGDSE